MSKISVLQIVWNGIILHGGYQVPVTVILYYYYIPIPG